MSNTFRQWADRGSCKGLTHKEVVTYFFPLKTSSIEILKAKEICAVCPVLEECREYALAHSDHGVWGGMSERERNVERSRRKREMSEAMNSQE